MPLNTKDSTDLHALSLRTPEEAESTNPSFSDTFTAAFRLENPVFNTMNRLVKDMGLENRQLDITYDPFQEPSLQNLKLTEDELDEFVTSKNREDYLQRLDSVLKRRRDLNTMSESGLSDSLITYTMAGLTDPINLLPLGVFAKNIKVGSKVATTALQTTATGALSIGTSEAALKLTQRGRTDEEFIQNTLAGTTLSALLGIGGGLAGKVLNKQAQKIKTATQVDPLQDINHFADHAEVFDPELLDKSIGAAQAPIRKQTLEELGFDPGDNLIGKNLFKGMERATRFISPALRLMNNSNIAIREITQDLIELPLIQKGADIFAAPQAVETLIQDIRTNLAKGIKNHTKFYSKYRRASKGDAETVLAKEQFDEQVAKAMRRDDISDNEWVQKTAESYRNHVFKPLSDEAIEVDLLPEGITPDTAQSYLTRMWNTPKIISREPEFRNILKKHFNKDLIKEVQKLNAIMIRADRIRGKEKLSKSQKNLIARADKAKMDVSSVFSKINRERYLESAVDNTLNSLKGFDHLTSVPNIKIAVRGPLKERTLNIPDIEVEDFLVNDISLLAERFSRTIKPEIELKRKFGTIEFDEMKEQILSKHNENIKGITDPEELLRLNNEVKAGITDMGHIWDLVRGTYSAKLGDPDSTWRRASGFIRDINYLRSMGQVVVASIPDTGALMRMGVGRSFRHGIKPLVKNALSGKQKLNTKIAQQYGKATEAVLANRVASMFNIGDPVRPRESYIERMASHAASKFGNITPINYWNNMMQEISVMATEQRIIENLISSSATENKWMNFVGLDDSMRKRIAVQLEKHKDIIDDVTLTNVRKWDDSDARRAITAAINKEVDRIIVVKKIGDAPIVTNTPAGKVMSQFLNFLMASNQRVLLAGLQQADANVMMSYATMVGLGMMVYAFRTPQDKISDDPTVWIKEGLDRSGILAVPFYFGNIGKDVIDKRPERALTSALGPTASMGISLGKVAGGLTDGSINETDLKNIRRIMPYQNIIWLGLIEKAFDERAESFIAEGLDLPKKTKRKKKLRRIQ